MTEIMSTADLKSLLEKRRRDRIEQEKEKNYLRSKILLSFGQRGNHFLLGESSPTSAISCNRRQLAWNVHSQYTEQQSSSMVDLIKTTLMLRYNKK